MTLQDEVFGSGFAVRIRMSVSIAHRASENSEKSLRQYWEVPHIPYTHKLRQKNHPLR